MWRDEMSSFDARLRLPGSRLPLGVEVDILHERMTVTSGERTVAQWPLERLDVALRPDGFHVRVDGEELVLSVSDSNRFAAELGVGNPVHTTKPSAARLAAKAESNEADLAALRGRISELARDLTSNSVSPEDVFSRWLKLLKELNRLHVEGALPNPLFHQLNTYLLDLIPEPVVAPI
jgi:hypothetical protein